MPRLTVPEYRGRCMKLNTHLHLAWTLRVCGVTHLLPHTPPWNAQGLYVSFQLYPDLGKLIPQYKKYRKISTLRTAFFWVITQRVVEISYRRFGTTYRSLSSGVKNPKESMLSQYGVYIGKSVVPEEGTGGRPETSVRYYHYSLRNNPEVNSSRLLRGGSLK
jgi:hypothetical protein